MERMYKLHDLLTDNTQINVGIAVAPAQGREREIAEKYSQEYELMLKALQLENEARMLEANADGIEARADALDEKMEELEERIEEIEEQEDDDH